MGRKKDIFRRSVQYDLTAHNAIPVLKEWNYNLKKSPNESRYPTSLIGVLAGIVANCVGMYLYLSRYRSGMTAEDLTLGGNK